MVGLDSSSCIWSNYVPLIPVITKAAKQYSVFLVFLLMVFNLWVIAFTQMVCSQSNTTYLSLFCGQLQLEFTNVSLGIAFLTKQSPLSILKCLSANGVIVIYIYLKLPHKKEFLLLPKYFTQSLLYAKFLTEKEIWLKTQFFHSVACISAFIKSHQFEVFEGLCRSALPFVGKVFHSDQRAVKSGQHFPPLTTSTQQNILNTNQFHEPASGLP